MSRQTGITLLGLLRRYNLFVTLHALYYDYSYVYRCFYNYILYHKTNEMRKLEAIVTYLKKGNTYVDTLIKMEPSYFIDRDTKIQQLRTLFDYVNRNIEGDNYYLIQRDSEDQLREQLNSRLKRIALSAGYNKKACAYFDLLANMLNVSIWHMENGGEFVVRHKRSYYRADAYILSKNIWIEYDEKHHERQFDNDMQRQLFIESVLHCTFIRMKECTTFELFCEQFPFHLFWQ